MEAPPKKEKSGKFQIPWGIVIFVVILVLIAILTYRR